MTLLHDCLNTRNQQGFVRLLDAAASANGSNGGLSTSAGKSWSKGMSGIVDVNARDWLGRTALHLACTSLENVEFVRALLKHPGINVNLPDTESHWTALHRALYSANFPAALLLLQRNDTDTTLKDLEGYTAFDLYNSTRTRQARGELFTWGANRNAALGLGDGDDRGHPEQPKQEWAKSIDARFGPIHVNKVYMSKLHTALVTEERTGNVRVCGFGSGGRAGEVLSGAWPIRAAGGDASMQLVPKRVYGPLRKEVVRGIAATKTASACWTAEVVYTWGTNGGQLGYDKSTNPLQIQPRIVSLITRPVQDIALSENVMACLLITQQVECIWNDRHVRVNFPAHIFPSEIQPYRPPQATKDSDIKKITTCDDVFAALSSNGEVFIFNAPNAPRFKPQRVWALRKKFSAVRDVDVGADGSIIVCTESGHVFVRSRSSGKSAPGVGKFQHIPHLQRVTGVCANSTGAFGALRVDYVPEAIELLGNGISEDLCSIQPYLALFRKPEEDVRMKVPGETLPLHVDAELDLVGIEVDGEPEEERDEYDLGVMKDVEGVKALCEVLVWEREMRKVGGGSVALGCDGMRLPHGADALVHVQSVGAMFPVHRVILAARCPALYGVLSAVGSHVILDPKPPPGTSTPVSIRLMASKLPVLGTKQLPRLSVSGCHPLSVLIFMRYLYSDELLGIWDRRIYTALERELTAAKVSGAQVKVELQALARALSLPLLSAALEPPVKRNPTPSMENAMTKLFDATQNFGLNAPPSLIRDPLAPDVILQLADRDVFCHSAILRSRSEFFGSFFDEEEWTRKRRDAFGMVKVDMRHLEWHVMQFVLRFLCCGADLKMFDCLDFTQSVEDVLQFMFDVMAAANELLLDRLVLLCSSVILKFTNLYNACSILAEATYFNAEQLIDRVQSYMTVNMEAFMDGRMLNSIPHALAKQLSKFVKGKQTEKSPVSRSGKLAQAAPIVNRANRGPLRRDSKVSPPTPCRRPSRPSFSGATPPESPKVLPAQTLRRPPAGDDIFEMDDTDEMPETVSQSQGVTSPPVWKPASRPRVDMKTVMAEAAAGQRSQHDTPFSTPNGSTSNLFMPVHAVARKSSWNDVPRTPPAASHVRAPGGSPWKTPAEAAAAKHSLPGTPVTPPRPRAPTSNISASKPAASTTPQQPTLPGLGPVITPTRQPSSKPTASTVRHPVIATSPPTAGMSFVAIQHSQLDQVPDPTKDKRSLREIQEEEQARQAEADFMKWWHEEEERFQASATQRNNPRGGDGRGGKPKGKPGGGRGGRGGKKADKQPEGNPDGGRKGDNKHQADVTQDINNNANNAGHPRHRPRKPAKDKAAV
ncbi:hypothetical protein BDQ17DRAFT_1392318 [Cyathus striatus]|nr:hypothetical protein BDQ17DRAFT_1392318 [Cyathus striatus]